jgi:PAS domain S-box-containing protein
MKVTPEHQTPSEQESDAATLLRQDVLQIFRAGAAGAAIFATVVGVIEFALFGFEYWGSVLTSTGTGIMAGLFFWLSHRGHDMAASWVLIVGVWLMILVDAAIQNGSATHGVVALPMLVVVAVWLTGSAWATYALAIVSTLTLAFVEILLLNEIIVPQGLSSPLVGMSIIGLILTLSAYIGLRIYHSHLERLHHQQKLAENLAESQHDMQLILDNSADPYYRTDLNGNIVMMSPSIEGITGYRTDELLSQPLVDFYADPNKRQEFLEELEKNNGVVTNFEADLVCKDGHLATVSASSHYWKDRDGNILGVEGNVRDVTHLKSLQEKIERAGRVEVLDQLSGGLAHNFNNLLAIVLGNTEMIRMSLHDRKEVEQRLTLIEQATRRGVDLTRRMMAFSSHSMSADRSEVDVNELLATIAPMISTSFSQDIKLELRPGHHVGLTNCHAGELEDAIINLAMNARDAIGDKGHVTILTRDVHATASEALNPEFKAGDCVEITVEDNGHGIPENLVNRIIEPFFTTKSRDKGTGLGLSMVYGFVRRYGGDLRFSSTEGEGTRVTILLPRSTVEREAKSLPKESYKTSRSLGKILVVEDEPELLELSERRLQEMGYHTTGVESGVHAKAFLEGDEIIDAVFSDVVMPGGISGFDLVDILHELRPTIPIVLCTGYAGAKGREAHPDVPLLNKPFRTEELAQTLHDAIQKGWGRSKGTE